MTENQLPVRPSTFAELEKLIGQELGPTEWYDITQERINAFAEATNDHQWIHVDPERAASSPLGSTIAHGLFSLSLGPSSPTNSSTSTASPTASITATTRFASPLPFPWDPGSACAQPSCPRSSCPAESK